MLLRPKSKNTDWEDGPMEGAPFDHSAVPNTFYFDVESIGNLEPDTIVQQGIKVLQQKLAAVLQDLTGDDGAAVRGNDDYEPRSPGMNGTNGGDYAMEHGFTTPYGGGGGTSAWGGGATPYGATPYGQGTNGWS